MTKEPALAMFDLQLDKASAEIFELEAERYDRYKSTDELAKAYRRMAQIYRERAAARESAG